jgi:hypothetical protein
MTLGECSIKRGNRSPFRGDLVVFRAFGLTPGGVSWVRWGARGLVLAWGLFWVWFCVASAVSELATEGPGAMAAHLLQALVVAAGVAVAWRNDLWGGLALLAIAALAWIGFAPRHWLVGLLMLAAPIVGGLLLLGVASHAAAVRRT